MKITKIRQTETKNFFQRCRTYFLTGIAVTAPIGITIYISIIFINFIDRNVKNLVPSTYNPDNYLPFDIPGTGLIIAIFSLILIGFFTASFFGKFFVNLGEKIINRLPVFRSIYNALKQVFQTVLGSSSKAFREVALIQYPRKGIWAVAFITAETSGEIAIKLKRKHVNVFLPTTPNPTSGFLLVVPENDLIKLNMNIEQGMKLVISGGIITPDVKNKIKKKSSLRKVNQ
ncbi:MAG: hypothetical protein CMJ08_02475 [Pelagibacterales bacterium]|nr:hypothetical protein [Pelagibacterales bacterium]|tara:strand:+ start:10496 stop:11185 length:690 start_codon:yes stop_codon:yes gene_type:complete